MILLAAYTAGVLAAGCGLGAWAMRRHTEIRKMEYTFSRARLLERDVEKVADDTGQDLIVAALPSERSARPADVVEDWPPFPHESFSDRRRSVR